MVKPSESPTTAPRLRDKSAAERGMGRASPAVADNSRLARETAGETRTAIRRWFSPRCGPRTVELASQRERSSRRTTEIAFGVALRSRRTLSYVLRPRVTDSIRCASLIYSYSHIGSRSKANTAARPRSVQIMASCGRPSEGQTWRGGAGSDAVQSTPVHA